VQSWCNDLLIRFSMVHKRFNGAPYAGSRRNVTQSAR
jgi:hypothetical protein